MRLFISLIRIVLGAPLLLLVCVFIGGFNFLLAGPEDTKDMLKDLTDDYMDGFNRE